MTYAYDREMGTVFRAMRCSHTSRCLTTWPTARRVRHRPADEISRRVEGALHMVDLAGLGNRRPDQLWRPAATASHLLAASSWGLRFCYWMSR